MGNKKEWQAEQAYLTFVYDKLLATQKQVVAEAEDTNESSKQFVQELSSDLRMSSDSVSDSFESLIEVEQKNQELAQINYKREWLEKQKHNLAQLLTTPYFAKIDVLYPDEAEIEKFYIGVAGFSDEEHHQYIYDWRSPIANLYYENNLGQTSYEAPMGNIPVDLKNRRQLKVEENRLIDFFDTSTAIEDPMLLQVLNEESNAKLQDITSTIQREQNEIIRDTQSEVLLIEGIAGSGKTSTILQRIAYLLYRFRENLLPEQVLLLSPNPMFSKYIEEVLPSLGEKNPRQMTYRDLIKNQGRMLPVDSLEDQLKRKGYTSSVAQMKKIEKHVKNLKVDELILRDITHDGKVLISKQWIFDELSMLPQETEMYRQLEFIREKMTDRLQSYITAESRKDYWRDEVQSLSNEEYQQLFPKGMKGKEEVNIEKIALRILTRRHQKSRSRINRYVWLDMEGHYEQATGQKLQPPLTLDQGTEFAYLNYLMLRKRDERRVKYMIIDEVQDYSETQLYFLAQIFHQAHFTLVGDGFQSVFDQGTTFKKVKEIFETVDFDVTFRELKKSYRSSGPISQFMKNLAGGEKSGIEVVNRPGKDVEAEKFVDEESYLRHLDRLIAERPTAYRQAILTKDSETAVSLFKKLNRASDSRLVADGGSMSFSMKTLIMPVYLAKGLEFDRVVVHDVSEEEYQTPLDLNILYTASSRAMHELYLPYIGKPSLFLSSL
ncbi:HelD family protein [Vagococcus elongatus]|nr:AAA family ATPase [Vagococcus elongatus]